LSELDTETADLDLMVDPPEEVELAVPTPARQVTGPVEPTSRLPTERVGHEALGGQIRTVQIAATHSGTADVELTGRARRHRTQIPIGQVHRRVGHRVADRQVQILTNRTGRQLVERRGDRRLGQPEDVDEWHTERLPV